MWKPDCPLLGVNLGKADIRVLAIDGGRWADFFALEKLKRESFDKVT